MSVNTEIELLKHIDSCLNDGNGDAEVLISELGEIVRMTSLMMSSDNMWKYTIDLAESAEIWSLIDLTINRSLGNNIKYNMNQLRLLKGLILMIRNLSIAYREQHDDVSDFNNTHNALVTRLGMHLAEIYDSSEGMSIKHKALDVSIVCFHCVFNFMQSSKSRDTTIVQKSIALLDTIFQQMLITGDLFELKQVLPQFKAYCLIPETRIEIVKDDATVFIHLLQAMAKILNVSVDINIEKLQDYETDDYKMIVILAHSLVYLFDDEKIGIAMYKLEKKGNEKDTNAILLYLIACQMTFSIQQSNPNWDFVAIAAVCLDFFHEFRNVNVSLLKKEQLTTTEALKLRIYHRKMVALLDIISNLLPYELFKKTFNSYNFLEELIHFFQVVEDNTERRRLKDEEQNTTNPLKKSFGNIKTIVVEIITYLVHGDPQNQEKVRESGGLLLILNNCNLDVNEPFIRERCILCLKYLLENNKENQNLVASLQAQGFETNKENENVLEKCGYEVEIVDGKVQLKKNTVPTE